MQILRKPAVSEKVGLSSVHVMRLVRDGKFPAPVRLGPASIGWLSSEVDEWIQRRVDQRIHPIEPLPATDEEVR